ncbi:hypothetical protein KR032_008649 [Drosophila birchii]|nr:hypothetical protein KR032_008649 [Drosophila birchii]
MCEKPLDCLQGSSSVSWYRGLSLFQTEACDQLLNALRDDMEEESAYRIRRCLSHLGLNPLVRSAQIKTIMGISQGSDLAFLWFLWEASYKQPRGKHEKIDPTTYTANEQLLLSAIAHLDMPSTLRALDKLLPPACQSKKSRPQCRNVVQKSTVRTRQPKKRDQGSVLPYLERLVRPHPFPSRGKYQPPETKVLFPDYLHYANRMLAIPNERCRWFADYQLCPQKRVVMRLLNEELDRLLNSQSPEEAGPLCETHRSIGKLVKNQREKVFQRCLAQLDVPGSEMKARRKKIVADLEREIECAADKIRAESQRLLTQVKSIRNEDETGSCQLCNSIVSTPRQCTRPKADLSLLMMGQNDVDIHRMDQYDQQDEQVKVMLMQSNEPNRCGAGDCKFIKDENKQKKIKQDKPDSGKNVKLNLSISQTPSLKSQRSSRLKRKLGKSKENLPLVPPSVTTEKLADRIPFCSRTLPCVIKKDLRSPGSETFIRKTVKGLMLDYNKVFDLPGIPEEHLPLESPDNVGVEDKQRVIEKLCIAALNEGRTKTVKEQRRDENLSPVLKAAATCAVDMLQKNLVETKENAKEPKTTNGQEKKYVLIDPDNKQQIEDILKAALQTLRKNPHFVLASFPNAHKLPVLLDWVADRYGKTFSQKEMQAVADSSLDIYERVYQDQDREDELKKIVLDLSEEVNYSNIQNLLCLTNQRKKKYHKKLNESAMEHLRLIWFGLRGYSHLGGHIKDTFFSYMPAREIDIKREFIWKPSDYRNMVQHRHDVQRRSNALSGVAI